MKAKPKKTDHYFHQLSSVEVQTKNRAAWNISIKYMGVLLGAIFAIVLSEPDLVKSRIYWGVNLADVVMIYFTLGGIGILLHEVKLAVDEHREQVSDYPLWMKRVVFGYLLVGLIIFLVLFKGLLS